MRAILLGSILFATSAGAVSIQLPREYPVEPDEAVAIFQSAAQSLKARPSPLTASELRPSLHIGRAIEIQGTFAGRVVINADSPDRRSALMRFELTNGVCICANSSSEVAGLQTGEPVRAVLDVPEGSPEDAKFRLRAIVRAYDLPTEYPKPAGAEDENVAVEAKPAPAAIQPSELKSNMALPPELRGSNPTPLPTLAPCATPTNGIPRPGKEGTWDPVGTIGIPVVSEATLKPWRTFIQRHNSRLDDSQANWIARWVIYYSALNGVDHRLMFAMIKCESDFNPYDVSSAGAAGLTQLMPCNLEDFHVVNKWNVQDNIRAGVEHFTEMLNMWKGRNSYEQFALGAASYNAGPNRVKRCGGIPNITETKNYVKRLGDLFYRLWQDGYP